MLSFVTQNWLWFAFPLVMLLMHRGHGGHGGHGGRIDQGGHRGGCGSHGKQDSQPDRETGHGGHTELPARVAPRGDDVRSRPGSPT